MVSWGRTFLTAAAVLIATPSVAYAAVGLDCMAQSYGAEDQASIESLSKDFAFDEEGKSKSGGDKLAEIGFKATYTCYDKGSWTEDQLYFASLFELGRISEAAYRQSGRLSVEQLQRIDQALAERDRTDLWAAMERAVQAGLDNKEAQPTARDNLVIGGFMLATGFDEDTAERVGEFLATMVLQRMGKREFLALDQGI